MSDPISDFLTQIRNGYLASKKEVSVHHSRMKEGLAQILCKEGFLKKFLREKDSNRLVMRLAYYQQRPSVRKIKLVSKPGRKFYLHCREIAKFRSGMGRLILSTSKGLMTDREALKKNLGGEVVCHIW
ncbi:30S ribosomal protein S8 [Patescibacteria group bacterium]